ncbi:hypothetical protein Pla123a_05360 [Posidoniimonas polymericola]|uniref:DinB superfamily protein n=1 Tax=Posidoniimonas polymericola TaxID=2528002 RepID=A0A5C5ZE79_9BACT|nr:DUF1569 domain-containing protein [Posidoniimonas polymericola]TWT85729.1 hypothetical protein Pla123a_05360 [Posidoniimonas polymericola]
MGKRKLSFGSLDEAADEIRRLRDGGYQPLVKWNLSECCEHLDKTMQAGMTGSIKPLPWVLRATVFRAMTEAIMAIGRMPGGAPAPPEIAPQEHAEDEPAVIDACLATLDRAAAFQDPLPTHMFSTGMNARKWKRLMCVHAAHHLGNLQPKQG